MIVDDSHFAYLRLQKGSLDHLAGDRAAWLVAYEQALAVDLADLKPHLPACCASVIDVGSGLGGIDVLLDRHYGGIYVYLLDGVDDPPKMTLHRRTFNSMKVAGNFLAKNGVRQWRYVESPERSAVCADLVMSLGSWCFHYPPSEYLAFVRRCCMAGTVLILDVRKDKLLWREELRSAFIEVAVARSAAKFERVVFHAR